jgi:hypothetical protein
MATLKHKKKYGELVVNCDCGREHTISQDKEEGKDPIFIMETDDTNLKLTDYADQKNKEKEKGNENKNNDGGTILKKDDNSGKKKSFLDFEL